MKIPTDYIPGYEKARAIAPDIADNYIAHTHIGDPLGEEMMDDLSKFKQEEAHLLIQSAMDNEGEEALRNAPASLRTLFKEAEAVPEWLDYSGFAPAVRMFHRNSQVILAAFVAGVLIEGFTTNIAKSFFITGRLRDQGVRRLGQNNRHMIEIFLPGGLYRDGDGWKTFRTHQDSSRTAKTPPEPFGRVGHRSLGCTDQRCAFGLRHLRFFCKAAETHENPGRSIQ